MQQRGSTQSSINYIPAAFTFSVRATTCSLVTLQPRASLPFSLQQPLRFMEPTVGNPPLRRRRQQQPVVLPQAEADEQLDLDDGPLPFLDGAPLLHRLLALAGLLLIFTLIFFGLEAALRKAIKALTPQEEEYGDLN